MKTRFFMAALAALAIVGCNKELGTTDAPEVNSESAVLKVNVKAAGSMTKADPGTFEYGEENENAVSKVDFYFFDATGAAYKVASTGTNKIEWTKQTPVQNVAKISDVVLVIKKSQTALPTHVVAVVNSTANYSNLSIDQLAQDAIETLTDNGFIMTNSVYVDGKGAKIVATEILPENIFATSDDLGAEGSVVTDANIEKYGINPVDIYVERVAAKVRVTLPDAERIPVMDETGKVHMKDANGNLVYAEVCGWDITNCTEETYLLKNVDPTWDLSFIWNNPAFFRSYWANTAGTPAHPHTYTALLKHKPEFDYYHENTLPAAEHNSVVKGEGNQTPQLLVAAKLVDANGAAISLAKWYNVLYTIDDLKLAMVNKLAAKLYVKNGENQYVSVNVDDVDFQQVAEDTEDNRYEVYALPKTGVTYYAINGTEVAEINGDALAAVFEDLDPAMMWEEGMTYYHTNINHFGSETGIVRNHVYDVTVNGVMGFGTPVYNPDHKITPEDPDEQPAANLAAQINILSWHVVSQDVTLQ